MRRYIIGAIAGAFAMVTLLVGGVALAAVTVTLTGPATYASIQWKSMCVSNKNGSQTYRANMEVCPSSSVSGVTGACSSVEIESATLTAGLQTVINYMITQWCNAHTGYCS